MNHNDIDFFRKELKPSPFTRNGFDDALRNKIEQKLDTPPKPSLAWVPFAAGLCMALIFLLIYMPFDKEDLPMEITASDTDTTLSKLAISNVDVPVTSDTQSAVLLAFRDDHGDASPPHSTYRTLLISHDNGNVELATQGNHLIVPYGQQFWQITPVVVNEADARTRLTAQPIAVAPRATVTLNREIQPATIQHEKVLFAGNRYISIQDDIRTANRREVNLWVKELFQLEPDSPSETSGDLSAVDRSHVKLQDIFGDRVTGDQWTIQRKPGHWAAQAVQAASESGERLPLLEVPFDLPVSVVDHDRLSVTWEQIVEIEPDARDAIASPNDDMIIVLTDKELKAFTMHAETIYPDSQLIVPLAEDESLIMNQWALDQYVPIWKEKVRAYFNPVREK